MEYCMSLCCFWEQSYDDAFRPKLSYQNQYVAFESTSYVWVMWTVLRFNLSMCQLRLEPMLLQCGLLIYQSQFTLPYTSQLHLDHG